MCDPDGMTVRAVTTWRLHVASGTVDSCRRVVERVSAALGVEASPTSLERHWKDPAQHVAVFTTPLDDADPAAGVLQTLTLAGRLRSDWRLTPPQVEDDGSWSVELVAAADPSGGGFVVPGVTWAHVTAGTHVEQ